MKLSVFAAAAVLVIGISPATAQSVPDDTRCLMLSNVYAKAAKDEEGRRAASQSLLFYLGRLDGRASPAAIAAGIRALAPKIDPKTSNVQMAACADRVGHAQQAITAATNPGRPAAK